MGGVIVLLGTLTFSLVPTAITIVAVTRYANAVGSPIARRLLRAEWAGLVVVAITRIGGYFLTWQNARALAVSVGLNRNAVAFPYVTVSTVFYALSSIIAVTIGVVIALSFMTILRTAADDHQRLSGITVAPDAEPA